MKKILNIVLKDMIWKILSVLIAATLWYVVTDRNNPIVTQNISVNLSVLNSDKVLNSNKVILNEEDLKKVNVTFRMRATRTDFEALRTKRDELKAYIDMSPIDIWAIDKILENLPAQVYYELPPSLNASNYDIREISPSTVNIVLDNRETRNFLIEPNILGTPESDYEIEGILLSRSEVAVIGAESIIETVGTVKVDINVEGQIESIENEKIGINVLDKNGLDITEKLKLVTKEVVVTVSLQRTVRQPTPASPIPTQRIPATPVPTEAPTPVPLVNEQSEIVEDSGENENSEFEEVTATSEPSITSTDIIYEECEAEVSTETPTDETIAISIDETQSLIDSESTDALN